ncbi:hypothetical protein [Pontibacter litorisediminis]|uniref:hypothetical protein n=1 Tax=Pontibacter litorisediminis TaxID=1846260 RepID=UPI0023EB6116|nr:hypothetical protein [Pontibacter litorisediminis]
MNRFLSRTQAADLLQHLLSSGIPTEYEPEKHRLALLSETRDVLAHFRLPITLPFPETGRLVNYVILLIQSGNCAMGFFRDGVNLDHKVWRSYMVRKKQGKSQIKYLKTKGKSRAGSRVRLGETAEFFENINGRLQEYFEEHEVHRIAISCSKTLLPYLYNSKVATPFDKHDPRLFKIPRHIHPPIYEVLLDANRFLQRGELIYGDAQQAMAEKLLLSAGISAEAMAIPEETYPDGGTEWDEDFVDEDEIYLDEEEDDITEW